MPRQLLSAGAHKRRKSQRNKKPTQTFNPPQWRHRDDADKRRHVAEAKKKRSERKPAKKSPPNKSPKRAKKSPRRAKKSPRRAKKSPKRSGRNPWLVALKKARDDNKNMFAYGGNQYYRQPGKGLAMYKRKRSQRK